MEDYQVKAYEFVSNRRKMLAITWTVIQLIVFCFIISALVVAGASWNGSFTFMAVWVLLLNLAMSVGGTCIMQKVNTELGIGFFLGTLVMMACVMITVAVAAGGNLAGIPSRDSKSSEIAVCVFSTMLALLYLVFFVMLGTNRDLLIDEPFDLAGSLRSPGDEGVQKPLQEERVEAEEKYSSV